MRNRNGGFTILEGVIIVAIFAIIFGALYQVAKRLQEASYLDFF